MILNKEIDFLDRYKRKIFELQSIIDSGDMQYSYNVAQRIHNERRLYSVRGGRTDVELTALDCEFARIGERFYDKVPPRMLYQLRRIGYEGGRYDISRKEALRWIKSHKEAVEIRNLKSAINGRIARFGSATVDDFPNYPRHIVSSYLSGDKE